MRVRFASFLLLGVAIAISAVAAPERAAAKTVWLCDPRETPNPCRDTLETTIQRSSGESRVVDPRLPRRPKVDCFYVYPTVSDQPTLNADKSKSPEVVAIARYQASRFSQRCRVWAPVYRQQTIVGLATASEEMTRQALELAYSDVLEAWRTYFRRHNHGRGVVLVGHSQGGGMLMRLIRERIDRRPSVRRRIVSAILPGANVTVRRGSDVGGVFHHVPACERRAETGCVLAWSTFNERPPDDTRFGVPESRFAAAFDFPTGPRVEALCTNPASIARNRRRQAHSLSRTEPFPGIIGALLVQLYGGVPPTAPTPWVRPAERYSVRCVSSNGANVLMARSIGDARKLNPSPDDTWGLHLVDVNFPLGQLVRTVKAQAHSYLRANRGVPFPGGGS